MWVEKHGQKYRVRDLRGGGKVTVGGGYRTKTAARTALIQLEAELLRGDALVPRGGRMLLRTFVENTWWPHYRRGLKPSSEYSEGNRLANHILPLLGDYEIDDVDALVVQQWVRDLQDGHGPMSPTCKRSRRKLAPKTVGNCHGLLFVIMSAAIWHRLIRLNPCAGTTLPARVRKEMRFLSDPEMARLVAALPPHWRPLVMLLLGTGLRWGEAIGLRIKNVDLLATPPKLRVLEHLHELGGTGELVWTDPKSAASRRTVPFTLEVALVLTALVAGRDREAVVFTTPTGLTIRTRNFRRVWLKAIEAAGLEGLRIHDLRHTHAAILIGANRQLSAISRRLGHSSVAVTDTLYGHIRPEVDEGILSAIQTAMALIPPDDLEAEVLAEVTDVLS